MFHVKHEWAEWCAPFGLAIAPETAQRLDRYHDLLVERAIPMGAIAESDRDRIAGRHILDALRAAPAVDLGTDVVDLGSGAGLPGVPLAIACPGARFRLVELRRNRAALLELAVDTVPVPNAAVIPGDVARLGAGGADLVVARAFTDAGEGWRAAERLLRPAGRFAYWAGASFTPDEIPPDVTWITLEPPPQLAEAGPVVIMSRQ